MSPKHWYHFSFSRVVLLSLFIRIALIFYSEWHDQHATVKYTDIDYVVFSDAARYLVHPDPSLGNIAKGPLGSMLGLGDPYHRDTYRYTPLLALLMAPNILFFPSFGKFLFSICDILNGYLLRHILLSFVLPYIYSHPFYSCRNHGAERDKEDQMKRQAAMLASLHLLNPMVIAISTRGSSEAALGLLVLATLSHTMRAATSEAAAWLMEVLCEKERHVREVLLAQLRAGGGGDANDNGSVHIEEVEKEHEEKTAHERMVLENEWRCAQCMWDVAAVLLGLSTHWKVYPLIYGASIVATIVAKRDLYGVKSTWLRCLDLINAQSIRFTLISAGTFMLLNGIMYLLWGYPFLYETYLYHIHRFDPQHNFSPYWLPVFLSMPASTHFRSTPGRYVLPEWVLRFARSPLASFVPQMGLSLGAGVGISIRNREGGTAVHLPFVWFVQTTVFVTLNKVCTSQYFLWYLTLLPLVLPFLSLSLRKSIALVGAWAGVQALWLQAAYELEFLGREVHYRVWGYSVLFLVVNCWCIWEIVRGYGYGWWGAPQEVVVVMVAVAEEDSREKKREGKTKGKKKRRGRKR